MIKIEEENINPTETVFSLSLKREDGIVKLYCTTDNTGSDDTAEGFEWYLGAFGESNGKLVFTKALGLGEELFDKSLT